MVQDTMTCVCADAIPIFQLIANVYVDMHNLSTYQLVDILSRNRLCEARAGMLRGEEDKQIGSPRVVAREIVCDSRIRMRKSSSSGSRHHEPR